MRDRFNYWFWGNIILGGLFGSTTDFTDDAVVEFDPDQYFITMKQKNASREERLFQYSKRQARNFLLYSHAQIAKDLAVGEGEYLSTLYKYLEIDGKDIHSKSLGELRELYGNNTDIPSIAEAVLSQFYKKKVAS